MLFRIITGINGELKYDEDYGYYSTGIPTIHYKDNNKFRLDTEPNGSATIFFKDPPIEWIDIPDKEDVIHMCPEECFDSFKITLRKEICDRISSELLVTKETYIRSCLTGRMSIVYVIDPRDPDNVEKFERFLELKEGELTLEILKNNVE